MLNLLAQVRCFSSACEPRRTSVFSAPTSNYFLFSQHNLDHCSKRKATF